MSNDIIRWYRWLLAGSMVTVGLCCVALAFIAKSAKTVILIIYLISEGILGVVHCLNLQYLPGKCGVGIAFMMVWLITAELYPTNLRAQVNDTRESNHGITVLTLYPKKCH